MRHTSKSSLELSYPRKQSVDLTGDVDVAKNGLFKLVKSESGLDLERFLQELFAEADIEWSPAIEKSLANELIMTWDQISELEKAGMDVHSHTRTHRVLGTLNEEELDSELTGSRKDLSSYLDGKVEAVAYPVGYSIAGNDAIRGAVESAGYHIGFTNQSGVNLTTGTIDPLDVRRCAMDIDMSDEMFRGIMAVPCLLYTSPSPRDRQKSRMPSSA